MKRKIKVIFIVLMSVFCILLSTSCSNKTPVEINYQEPTQEISDKIYNAVKKDGSLIYAEIIAKDLTPWEVSEVTYLDVVAEFNDNYLVHFACDNHVYDGFSFAKLGEYCVRFNASGYGIYSLENDKLISCKQAYNEGLITDEVLDELYSCYKKEESKEKQDLLPGIKICEYIPGDITLNGEIDETDLSVLEASLKHDDKYFIFAREVGDMNGDGVTDSKDVEILSKKVKKNK